MGIIYGTGCGFDQNVAVAGSTIAGASGGGGRVYQTLRTPIDVKDLKRAVSVRQATNKFLNDRLGIQEDPAHDDIVFATNREFETKLNDYRRKNAVDLGEKPVFDQKK